MISAAWAQVKIVDSAVASILVDVMDNFACRQSSSEMLFHNVAVFHDALPIPIEGNRASVVIKLLVGFSESVTEFSPTLRNLARVSTEFPSNNVNSFELRVGDNIRILLVRPSTKGIFDNPE